MDPNHYLVPLLVGGLIAWRLYVRLRRNFGRQRMRHTGMVIRIIIFAVLTCLIGVFSFLDKRLFAGLAVGVVLAVPLGLLGLRLTKFESTPEGQFYTPNAMLGAGLTILLVVRLGYRLILLSNASQNPAQPPPLMHSPLSLFVFGLLAGYYITYYVGLLVRSKT